MKGISAGGAHLSRLYKYGNIYVSWPNSVAKKFLSFDTSVKWFDHFTQHIGISTFTKGIRNQVKFGHVISAAQNRQWLGHLHCEIYWHILLKTL